MQRKTKKVLLVESVPTIARRMARRIHAEGGEATIAGSVAEARNSRGPFDRGIFAFNLPDGTGIVLAAELMLEDRVGTVEFLHPNEPRFEQDEHWDRCRRRGDRNPGGKYTLIDLGCDLLQGYLLARPGLPFSTVPWWSCALSR